MRSPRSRRVLISSAEHQLLESQVRCDKQSEGAHPHRNRPAVHNRFPPEGKAQGMHEGDEEKDHPNDKGKRFLAHEISTSSRARGSGNLDPDCTPAEAEKAQKVPTESAIPTVLSVPTPYVLYRRIAVGQPTPANQARRANPTVGERRTPPNGGGLTPTNQARRTKPGISQPRSHSQ